MQVFSDPKCEACEYWDEVSRECVLDGRAREHYEGKDCLYFLEARR